MNVSRLMLVVSAAVVAVSCGETSSMLAVVSDVGYMPLARPLTTDAFTPPAALKYVTGGDIPETALSPCFQAGELTISAVSDAFTPFATMRLSDGLRYVPGKPDDSALRARSIANMNVAFGATAKEHADAAAVRTRVAALASATAEDEVRCKAALSRMVSGPRCFRAYLAMSALKAGAMRYQFLTAGGGKVPVTDELVGMLHLESPAVTKLDASTLEVKTAAYIGYDALWSFSMSTTPGGPDAIPVLGAAAASSVPSEGHGLLGDDVPPLPSGSLRIAGHSGFQDLMDFRRTICLEPSQ